MFERQAIYLNPDKTALNAGSPTHQPFFAERIELGEIIGTKKSVKNLGPVHAPSLCMDNSIAVSGSFPMWTAVWKAVSKSRGIPCPGFLVD